MDYIDTHCHLNHGLFQADIDEVLKRASDSKISLIVTPGWDVQSSAQAVLLAEKFPQVVAAIGIHPTECQKLSRDVYGEILRMAENPRVVAIGEIGLDFYHDPDHKTEQIELLHQMFLIAKTVNKPVILHSRESIDSLIDLLVNENDLTAKGIVHAFEGNLDQANVLFKLGYLLGVGGPLTYKNSTLKKLVFSQIDARAIAFETDAPYLPPTPNRGKRNEPSYLPLVSQCLCTIRSQNRDQLDHLIFQNSYKMFIQDNKL
ncbi:MAG: TatD family hydrolase [Anaerolineaceae bacterium]